MPRAGAEIPSMNAPAAGQALTPVPGAYEIKSYRQSIRCRGSAEDVIPLGERTAEFCWDKEPKDPGSLYPRGPFFVVASKERNKIDYKWVEWNGRLEIDNNSWIRYVCGFWGIAGGKVLQRNSFYTVMNAGPSYHKVEFQPTRARGAAAVSDPCPQTRIENMLASRIQLGPLGMMGMGMLPVEGQRRAVTGQLLFGLRNPSTTRDERLWSCIFIDGNYPGIHFVNQNRHADEWAFVWPSALFRVALVAGATYAWRLAPPIRCGILRAQSYRGEFRVPERPAPSEEKLLLGCLVADEGFSNCRSWWLHRP